MSLVAERPPKVAVGFNPAAAAEPSRQTISSRSDDRTIATRSAINVLHADAPRLQSSFRDESFLCHRHPWVETHGDHQMSRRDGRHLDREFWRDCGERGVGLTRAAIRLRIVKRLQWDVQA